MKIKNVILGIITILLLTSCLPKVDDVKKEILEESLPINYTLTSYDDYLPSKFSYYNFDKNESYYFEVTYSTSSNLIKIEPAEYYKDADKKYGSDLYDYTYRSHYKVELIEDGATIDVKCRYYDEEHDFEIIIDRTFVILPSKEYLASYLNKYSGIENWKYENGNFTAYYTKKSVVEYSASKKYTFNYTYNASYNPSTGEVVIDERCQTNKSVGWDNSTESSRKIHKYNMKTGQYFINDEKTELPTYYDHVMVKVVNSIKKFEALM